MERPAFTAASLPVLGVGASLSIGVEPDPVALAKAPGGPAFIEYAGPVTQSWVRPTVDALADLDVPVLYHPSNLNLSGTVENPAAWVAQVDAHVTAVGSAWLAQDVAQCFVHPAGGYSNQLGYFVPPVLTKGSLALAVDRVREVQDALSVPLLLEPAPVTYHLGDMDALVWLSALADATGSGLLLDCGHVVAHQMAAARKRATDPGCGLAADAGLSALDWARVVEVHIAGGTLQRPDDGPALYVDAHDVPILPETWHVFRTIVEAATELRAICVECEGASAHAVIPVLDQVRQRAVRLTPHDALRTKIERALEGGLA